MNKEYRNLSDLAKNFSDKEIFDSLEKLKSLDLRSATIDEVKVLVRPLLRCGFSTVTYPAGKPLFRGRVLGTDESINDTQKISYPPVDKVPELNRASTSKYQVFYGAEYRKVNDRDVGEATVTFEISNIYDSNFDSPFELIGMGYWIPTSDFTVVSVGLHSDIAKNNPDAKSISELHNDIAQGIPEMEPAMIAVAEFISNEFSKKVDSGNDHEYLISAAIGDLIFDLGFSAIMYPSVKFGGHAFNIAIHHECIDAIWECQHAYILKMRLIKGKAFSDYHLVSYEINSDQTFNWKEPPPQAVISNLEQKIIEAEIEKYGEFESTNWVIKEDDEKTDGNGKKQVN